MMNQATNQHYQGLAMATVQGIGQLLMTERTEPGRWRPKTTRKWVDLTLDIDQASSLYIGLYKAVIARNGSSETMVSLFCTLNDQLQKMPSTVRTIPGRDGSPRFLKQTLSLRLRASEARHARRLLAGQGHSERLETSEETARLASLEGLPKAEQERQALRVAQNTRGLAVSPQNTGRRSLFSPT